MEKINLLKEYVNSLGKDTKDFSETELFYLYLNFIEGYEFSFETIDIWFNLIKLLIKNERKNQVKSRLNELRNGDINFDDFSSCSELADYIEFGD